MSKSILRILASLCVTLILLLVTSVAEAEYFDSPRHAQSSSSSIGAFQQVAPGRGWLLFGGRLFWTNDDGAAWNDITPSQAEVETVTFKNNLQGWAILADPSASTPTYMLASTLNAGSSWQFKSLNLPELSQSPVPVSAVYMGWRDSQSGWLVFKLATGNNFSLGLLFVTADGGDTWQTHDVPLGEAATFVTDQIGWVAGGPGGDQLYRTQDGGQTWQSQQIAANAFYTQLPVFDTVNNGLISLVSGDGENVSADFYQTNDSGQTWTLAGRVPLQTDTPPNVDPPLSLLDSSHFLMVVPSTDRVARMDAGQLSEDVNADGNANGVVAVSISTLEAGWAKSATGNCIPNHNQGGMDCTQEVRLMSTTDGGIHWLSMTLPGTTQASLQQSFSMADKASAPEAGALSALDADTQAYAGQGFDICSIPSLSQMQTWWNGSPYNAVNLYIGGSMRACSNTSLSASYLSQLHAQGWRFIPTWVGPQASCSYFSSRMSSNTSTAYAQGVAEADAAMNVAYNLGLTETNKSGTVIYYDLEAYDTSNSNCRAAANAFVSGWTAELRAYGNVAGVYGASCASAVSDWNNVANVPDAIWIANWYGNAGTVSYTPTASVWGAYCLSDSLWSNHQRLRQYAGDHNETWGGLTLNIDSNVLDGVLTVPNGTANSSAPSTPINPGPANGSTLERTSNTRLTWKTSGDTCSVHVWGGSIDLTSSANCSQYLLGVRNGGAYSWQVISTNGFGFTTGPVWHFNSKPYAPGSLSAAAASSTKVNLNWSLSADEPANVDGYIIYADGGQAGSVTSGVSTYQVSNLACNSLHSFYVMSVRQGVKSSPTSTVNATTPTCAPLVNSPADGTVLNSKRPSFDWQSVTDATSYQVQISRYANLSSPLVNVSVTTITYTVGTDLAANTTFFWRVRARGAFGYGDWSPVISFTTANPPAIPLLVSPAANGLVTDYTPRLDWNDVSVPLGTSLDHYQVQVSSDVNFRSLLYDETTNVSEFIIPADLSPNAKYYWRVRAFDTLGQYSAWSTQRIFRTAILPPQLASPVDGTKLISLRTTLDWADVDGASSYTFQISRAVNFSTVLMTISPVGSTFILVRDLPANTVLYWRVRANGANGPSLWSSVWSFTTANPPGIPAPLSPANNALVTDYTPRIDWNTSTVPLGTVFDHYQLQIATDSLFTNIIADQDVSDLLISEWTPAIDLAVNTKYFWHVRAYNTAGEYSSWSVTRYFRTALTPPVLLYPSQADHVLTLRPAFDWEDVSGASGYTIQISRVSNFSTIVTSANSVGSTFTPATSLPANVTLYWRVRSNGVNGPSLWSQVGSFTSPNPPSVPALLSPVTGSNLAATPTLQWKPSIIPLGTTLDHYEIQIAANSSFTAVVQQGSAGLSTGFTPTSLPAGLYYWRVRSYNTNGEYSNWSTSWYFRILY